ncbi:Pumilio18 [Sesamum angolense]|uniref:Pumilio18 n=1 Tax=Sesamum angolense TaxID=2727404 RepID=A0AAE1VVA6_9LAMI|nr:Pumilio18 [Sesamum angolense]
MDSSTSPTPQNPTHHDDDEVILYVGRPQLGKYGTFQQPSPTANSQSNDDSDASLSDDDSDTFSVFSFKTQEDGIPITTTTSKKTVPGQDNSATKDTIWGCPRFFMTTSPGEKDVSNDQNLMDRQQRSNHMVHHFRRRPLPVPFPYADQRFRLMMLHKFRYPMKYGPRIPIRQPIQGQQLDLLVVRVLSQGEYFLRVAFDQQGASSIVKLIRKVRKSSPHAMAMTRVLSTRFMDIMTHPTARDVLYEKTILHFYDLAIHEVGCKSLNDCIALINGDQRVRLLNQIADVSDFLSYDPYGNYVVQNVLGLKDGDITSKITDCLENEFIQLAVRKEGSLVVEKRMEASNNGIIRVAAEIVNRPGAAFRLARNQFGNYVIQAALKKTKERGFSSFYDAIVRRLEPSRRALRRTAGGKNVLSIMEADDE